MNIEDIFRNTLHTMSVLDSPKRSAATALECNRAEQEGSSPTDDAGTAGVVLSQYRARIHEYERLIGQLHELLPDRADDAYDLVRAEFLAIHGVG
jgi:hypothetical protein